MKKGGIYTGYVDSVDFPNKGNVIVEIEEGKSSCEEFYTRTDGYIYGE